MLQVPRGPAHLGRASPSCSSQTLSPAPYPRHCPARVALFLRPHPPLLSLTHASLGQLSSRDRPDRHRSNVPTVFLCPHPVVPRVSFLLPEGNWTPLASQLMTLQRLPAPIRRKYSSPAMANKVLHHPVSPDLHTCVPTPALVPLHRLLPLNARGPLHASPPLTTPSKQPPPHPSPFSACTAPSLS